MIDTTKDALDKFERLMETRWNKIMSQFGNNIRVGTIREVNHTSRTARVEIDGTGQTLNRVKFQKGASIAMFEHDKVLLASPDPKLRNQNFIVGVYG